MFKELSSDTKVEDTKKRLSLNMSFLKIRLNPFLVK